MASIGLASWPIGWSSTQSLVERTVVSPLSGSDANDEEVVPHVSWIPAEFDSMPSDASCGGLGPPAHSSWVSPSQALDNILFGEDNVLFHLFL